MANIAKEYNEIIKTLDDSFYYVDLIGRLPVCGICLMWQESYIVNKAKNIDASLIRLNNLQSILTLDQKMNTSNSFEIIYTTYVTKSANLKQKYEID